MNTRSSSRNTHILHSTPISHSQETQSKHSPSPLHSPQGNSLPSVVDRVKPDIEATVKPGLREEDIDEQNRRAFMEENKKTEEEQRQEDEEVALFLMMMRKTREMEQAFFKENEEEEEAVVAPTADVIYALNDTAFTIKNEHQEMKESEEEGVDSIVIRDETSGVTRTANQTVFPTDAPSPTMLAMLNSEEMSAVVREVSSLASYKKKLSEDLKGKKRSGQSKAKKSGAAKKTKKASEEQKTKKASEEQKTKKASEEQKGKKQKAVFQPNQAQSIFLSQQKGQSETT